MKIFDNVTEIVRDFPHLKIQVAHMGRAKADNVPFMREIWVMSVWRSLHTSVFSFLNSRE